MKFDLVVAGVGGQGNILASQVVAHCAMDAGYNVVNTETKGAAQRGGSVLSHVRIDTGEIFSPLVPAGQADVLLGFEPLEALRHIKLLNSKGTFVINTVAIPTILAKLNVDEYPDTGQIKATIGAMGLNGHFVNATKAAKELGNVLLTNVVMLGAFTAVSDILAPDVILDKLLTMVDVKFREADSEALALGRSLIIGKRA